MTPLGLERAAQRELEFWWPFLSDKFESNSLPLEHLESHKGGLEILAPLKIGLQLNRVLKVPGRILLRLCSSECRELSTLKNLLRTLQFQGRILGQIELDPKIPISFSVSSIKSKLSHAGQIKEICEQVFRELGFSVSHSSGDLEENTEGQIVFVRFVDDRCIVSLDTSGEHLHRRGYRTHIGIAPIRENLASGLIWCLLENLPLYEIHKKILIDPMVGSGTFLTEAQQLFYPNFRRKFRFEDWGLSDVEKIDDSFSLLSQANLENRNLNKINFFSTETFKKFFGFERDAKTFSAAVHNIKELKLEDSPFQLMEGDFAESLFQFEVSDSWIIFNPPYGERLKLSGDRYEYYTSMLKNIERGFHPQKVGFILPAEINLQKMQTPKAWHYLRFHSLENGGIPIHFHVFQREERK